MMLCPALNWKISAQIVIIVVNLKAIEQREAQGCDCRVADKDYDEKSHLNVEFQINLMVFESFHYHRDD